MMKTNQIYNENCMETMSRMQDGFIDLTVTSPPYDNLRTYNDDIHLSWNQETWQEIIRELFRVTKDGGVVVWVVGDATINGSETGTSFKQALFAVECGFSLHDTMIYEKDSISFPDSNRYSQIFEFMFVLSVGRPKTTNLIRDRANLHYNGRKHIKGNYKSKTGERIRHNKENLLKEFGSRTNIWRISTGCNKSTKDTIANGHDAIFPEKLARDHIHSWSNEGDLIYDPFMGSGTTAKMAHLLKRNWIGSEISEKYVKLALKRIDPHLRQLSLF